MTDPVVELQSGHVRGSVEKHEEDFEYHSFKGIPYAEPPVGPLRFKDPAPKKKWTGVIDCKNDGPAYLQYNFFFKSTSYEEDCLYLNVYTRSVNRPDENKPVIVFVHLGAYVLGSASSSTYGPDYLLRKDVVLVGPNYRIGVLGFLDLRDEVAPGNQGLKNLVLALQWVQQNIREFGGDPDNVTVFGMGGATSAAHYLALSPLAKGLLHKVISNCGIAYHTWAAVVNPKSHAIKLCSILGKNLTDSKEILDFLKSIDTQRLLRAQQRLHESLDCLPFGPGVDAKSSTPFMPVHRYEAADQGVHLPYLVGCNSHETIFLLSGKSKEDFFKLADLDFGAIIANNANETLSRYGLTEKQVRRLYYKSDAVSQENGDNFFGFSKDFYFVEGVHRFARVQAEKSSAAAYLFLYSYEHANPL